MRLLSFFAPFFVIGTVCASEYTFVLQDVDSHQLLIQEGKVSTRMSPYCSFNIALSLMGFDSNILQDPENPVWPYKEEYETWLDGFRESWKAPHNPTTWIQNSCAWFSQVLTQKLGMESFSEYITEFQYGNQNLTGGLLYAWIGSSLLISPLEQAYFVSQLVREELPVSESAYENTRAILFVEELSNGMKLYGKTGSGSHAIGRENDVRVGWFVGWVEKGNARLSFAYRLEGPESHVTGKAAKEELKQRLISLPSFSP